MRKALLLLFFAWLASLAPLSGQCEYPIDSVDVFDSTRLVAFKPITIGFLIPSQMETEDGPLMIEEAKMMFTFTQNDSLDAFFLSLLVAERGYNPIGNGFNVFFKLNNGQIVGLYNVPDRGTFDERTNMRIYQHMLLVPHDVFYNLTHHTIELIRINYQNMKKTIEVHPTQQEKLREAIRCIGEAVGLFPIKP